MGMKVNTEDTLVEAIQRVQTACASNQVMHLSHCFTGDPDHLAVVACYTVCPDDIAKDLHTELDATVAKFLAKHNIRKH